jgi:hypothetical protein
VVLARAISFAATKKDVSVTNASIMIAMPRVIPADEAIWHYIEADLSDLVRRCLDEGEASIYDVDNTGESLLMVGTHQLISSDVILPILKWLQYAVAWHAVTSARLLTEAGADPNWESADGS